MKEYKSDFGKAALYSAGAGLKISLPCFLVIYLFFYREIFLVDIVFILFCFVFLLNLILKWKTIVLEDYTLIVKRFFRKPNYYDVRNNHIGFYYPGHEVMFVSVIVNPFIRIISYNTDITEVDCANFSKTTMEELRMDIRKVQNTSGVI